MARAKKLACWWRTANIFIIVQHVFIPLETQRKDSWNAARRSLWNACMNQDDVGNYDAGFGTRLWAVCRLWKPLVDRTKYFCIRDMKYRNEYANRHPKVTCANETFPNNCQPITHPELKTGKRLSKNRSAGWREMTLGIVSIKQDFPGEDAERSCAFTPCQRISHDNYSETLLLSPPYSHSSLAVLMHVKLDPFPPLCL